VTRCCDGPKFSDGEKSIAIPTGSEKGVSEKAPSEEGTNSVSPGEKSVTASSPSGKTVGVVASSGKTVSTATSTEKSVSTATSSEKSVGSCSPTEKGIAVYGKTEKGISSVSPTEKTVLVSTSREKTLACYLPDLDDVNDGTVFTTAGHFLRADGTEWVNSAIQASDIAAAIAGTDHGALTGLGDDDHTQYHNDTRGDARYYTQTLLDAGQLDNRYFTETEHINTSAGVGDAGKPIKLDASGLIDSTMIAEVLALNDLSDVGVSPSANEYLYYTGSQWTSQLLVLDHNSDVDTTVDSDVNTAIADARVLYTPSLGLSPWQSARLGIGALYNVNLSGIADNDLLQYDSGTSKWVTTAFSTFESSLDHGNLAGLGDDDHTQYHNDTRGDARYYTQTLLDAGQLDNRYYTETELDAGQLDNRYFTEVEHINTSAGAGDAGKPIKLDAGGHIDATMINDADIDHVNIGSIGTNTHAQIDTHIADSTIHFTEASIDHGSIAGLGDDDHTQYHNDTRANTWFSGKDLADLGTKNHSDLDQLTWSTADHTIDTDFLPDTDASYDLGSILFQWQDLYLSGDIKDSGGSEIYVRRDGTLELTAAWTAGDEITADKFLADVTAEVATTGDYATDFGVNITITGATTEKYAGLFIDADYAWNTAFSLAGPEYTGLTIDYDMSGSVFLNSARCSAMSVSWDSSVVHSFTDQRDAPIGIAATLTNAGAYFNKGALGVLATSANTAGESYACSTEMVNSASSATSARICGYFGSGKGGTTGNGTFDGTIVGIVGYTWYAGAAARTMGFYSDPAAALSAGLTADKILSFYATRGQMLLANSSLFVANSSPIDCSALSPTHVSTTGTGEGWFASNFEVDGTIYGDASGTAAELLGDVIIKADNKKLALGADGATDSYLQYTGTSLAFYEDGGIYQLTGSAGADPQLQFVGDTNTGVLTWKEDEDYFQFSDDVVWVGDGAGLAYGHMYTNTQITVSISASSTPTEVNTGGTDFTTGEVNNVTFSDHYLAVDIAGRYKIDWAVSFNVSTGAADLAAGLMVNGTAKNEGRAQVTAFSLAASSHSCGSTCILDLAANDQVSLYVENLTDTTDIDVDNGNLTVVQIGGT